PFSQKDKKFFIGFDGVYKNSEVFINGHSLGIRPNGYLSFQYDITPHLKYGEKNVIAVKVDNSQQPNSRWYSGSGIYRNVWFPKVHPVHISNWGTYVTTPAVSKERATVTIETKVANEYESGKDFVVSNTIYDATGKLIMKGISLANQAGKSIAGYKQALNIYNPVLWSVDKPYLYKLVSEVSVNKKVVDVYETSFGIRYFDFNAEKGFSLNGEPLKILGVCNHHDLGALGAAINTRALERQLVILKAMGCNGIRTAHNPPAPELLDLADKMGFIVMDEAFDMWAKPKSPFDYHLDW